MPSSRSTGRHQTGRAQVGDTLQRVSTSSGRDGSSTSSAAILFCCTADTFIPHSSPSLQTGGGTWRAPDSSVRKVWCLYKRKCTEGVTGSEGQEGANGVGGGIGVGGGNEDGNGVGGGNGDVNGHGDGDGSGTGTGVDVNEGAQDGDGAGTGTGTGVETRR